MKNKFLIRVLSILCLVLLVAAVAVLPSGCTVTKDDAQIVDSTEKTVLGEGKTVFDFSVTTPDNVKKNFEIHTDKTVVGDAILELSLISGEESQYGLYVKTVDGTTLNFEKDGKYWAFYVDGSYGVSGVDSTQIVAGSHYEFRAE